MKDMLRRNRGFLLFLLSFALVRTAVADWNPIPSGSMRPSLLEGDVVLVDRLAYDLKLPLSNVVLVRLGEPRRGDVVVFDSPRDGARLIKRLVALPGDWVELRDERLILNGEPAEYSELKTVQEVLGGATVPAVRGIERVDGSQRAVQVVPGVAAMRSFGPVQVPPGHYLMLGDNRDNSADSRVFGFVPRALLNGRAHHLLASVAITEDWQPRLERFFQRIE